jgi:hypothetical protein
MHHEMPASRRYGGVSITEDTLLMLWSTVDMSEPYIVEAVNLSSLALSEDERPPMDRYFIARDVSRTWALCPGNSSYGQPAI